MDTVLGLVDSFHKRPPLVSDHFLVHQGWSLTRELTVVVFLLRCGAVYYAVKDSSNFLVG